MSIILSDLYNLEGVKKYKEANYFEAALNFQKSLKEADKENNSDNIVLAIYNLVFTYKQKGDLFINTKNHIDGIKYYKESLEYANICKNYIPQDMKDNIIKLEKELSKYNF